MKHSRPDNVVGLRAAALALVRIGRKPPRRVGIDHTVLAGLRRRIHRDISPFGSLLLAALEVEEEDAGETPPISRRNGIDSEGAGGQESQRMKLRATGPGGSQVGEPYRKS